jgi:GTP-binding protein HflX
LPHELVASFRATMEEARHADLLLLVVDGSDPDLHQQLHVTQQTLREIGAGEVAQQIVLNKVDRLDALRRESLALTFPDAWLLSAHEPRDMVALRSRLVERFEQSLIEGDLFVPYSQGALLAEIHQRARVLAQQHTVRGTRLRVRAPAEVWSRFARAD